MKYLFEKHTLLLIESLTFTKTLFAFDYDGTLTPLISDYNKTKISEKIIEQLTLLKTFTPVAIISGRNTKDLKEIMKFKPNYLVGNNRLVGLSKGNNVDSKFEKICRSWYNDIRERLFSGEKNELGISIENKKYSIAIHYRKSRQKKIAKKWIQDVLAELSFSPKIVWGKSVVNIIPMGAPHKGVALLDVIEKSGCRNAFYIGDDITDEDVFNLHNYNIIKVRIGFKKNSAAKYYIKNQKEIKSLLSFLTESFMKNDKGR
ncbi:MAG: trehalose-phosphatase [Oligoflexia bacterium]|nr:trehalose-phosphatase [Oligoflexia bacterium]